jgi:tRNA threonylcarbamoyladenosine biosynthesis protein TsaB
LALILNIETATPVCSVCISREERILSVKEINQGLTHAENLHSFIESTLNEAGISVKELNAIALSKGPGSYTGLRIGSSAAKGLAFALQLPLISIDTLQAMAFGMRNDLNKESLLCPMLDARRMEVYTALYDSDLNIIEPIQALVMDSVTSEIFKRKEQIIFFGEGMSKCKTILEQNKNTVFVEDIVPSAINLAPLAFKKFRENSFEDLAYFEPLYLKEFFTPVKKR